VFFDRGLMDMYGTNGVLPYPTLLEAVRTRRYNRRVFVFPPWRQIYGTDDERREDWSRMPAVFEEIVATLPALGYEALVVPIGSVAERAAFVLSHAGP
jgi:predicted ATPase